MIATPRKHTARRLAVLAGLLVLSLAALAPVALARSSGTSHSTCKSASHRARHGSRSRRCARHKTTGKHETKNGSAHKAPSGGASESTRSGAAKPAAAVPARCEDSTLPTREPSGAFSCDDESEPACSEGSEPTAASGAALLMCTASAPSDGGAGVGTGECGGEAVCAVGDETCEANVAATDCVAQAAP